MNLDNISLKFSEEKKKEIIDAVKTNRKSMDTTQKYHSNALPFLFQEWHKLFPQQTQTLSCTGCRKAVTKFFTLLAENWEKQSVTRTGALSRP
tara:strand:- start:143 stop:421 length:279 start_codon:yes stop_codon:yes gene_type:complete